MKIVRFKKDQGPRLGVLRDDQVVDIKAVDDSFPTDLIEVLERDSDLVGMKTLLERAGVEACIPLDGLSYMTPIEWPRRILCLGLNYVDHVNESKFEKQVAPTVFVRTPTSFVAQEKPLVRPNASDRLDFEAELAVVIGKSARALSEDEALSVVLGYTCSNDGSIRDYQHNTVQWTMGKNFDRSGSIGPWITTADELPAGADDLDIECLLNGEVMQSSNTGNMIFKVAETISYISTAMTLLPGDIILTGTPHGVGHARKPPVFMKNGDTVEVRIESLGVLKNGIVDESKA